MKSIVAIEFFGQTTPENIKNNYLLDIFGKRHPHGIRPIHGAIERSRFGSNIQWRATWITMAPLGSELNKMIQQKFKWPPVALEIEIQKNPALSFTL